MAHTAVIGTAFVDIKGFSNTVYDPQGRNVGNVAIVHGGVARNVAENFVNVGMSASFVGMIDETAIGRDVERYLKEVGVDLSYALRVPANGIGIWMVILNERGDLAGSVSCMPELSSFEGFIDQRVDKIVADAEAIVLEMDLSEHIAETVIRAARQHGKPIYSIVGNATVVLSRKDLVRQTDCFICNNIEAAKFFEVADLAACSSEYMLDFLPNAAKAAGIASMVVTMGENGAVYFDGPNVESGICPPVPTDVVDTSGAGDAFFSGTVMGLIRGYQLSKAVTYGARLASETIGRVETTCPVDKDLFNH